MKRSSRMRKFTIGVAAISAFSLAACKEEVPPVSASLVKSPAECTSQPGMTTEQCEQIEKDALAAHLESAPRYDGLQICEEQHGVGNCEADPEVSSASGGSSLSSIFLPMMAGYLVGNALSNANAGRAMPAGQVTEDRERRAAPVYPMAGTNNVATATGTTVNGASRNVTVPSSSFDKAPVTAGKPPMSTTSVRSTGGFGGRSAVGG